MSGYDKYSALGTFLSPDSVVPDPSRPDALNRYQYSYNNPLRYTDPSGHFAQIAAGALVGGLIGGGLYLWNESRQDGFDLRSDWVDLLAASGEGAVAGALIMTPGGQAAGIGMASNLVGNHLENLALGQDFSTSEHLITGATGALEGAVGVTVVGKVGKAAQAAGAAGEALAGAEMLAQAGNAAVWGAVDGGAQAALNRQSISQGALSGAVQNGVTELFSWGAVDSVRKAGGITTVGEARAVELIHGIIPDGVVLFGRWVAGTAEQQQRILDSQSGCGAVDCE